MDALSDRQPQVDDLREFLIERRHHLGYIQQGLADRAGLSRDWIASFECGRLQGAPRTETLIKLGQAIALPGENPGLVNFMKLVLAGSFGRKVVLRVAKGELDANTVLRDSAKGPAAMPPESLAQQELWKKWQRLQEALSLIRLDLAPADFEIASALLHRMYGELPSIKPAAAGTPKPRRRRIGTADRPRKS